MAKYQKCTIHQGFGESPNTYKPLKGHPGFADSMCGYGSVVLSPVKGLVYSLYTPERPAKDGYTAVYILCKTSLEVFELSIGHLSKIYVKVGDMVDVGTPLGEEGNKGYVFQGGKQITLAMQKAGSKEGSHRHNQKRVLRETFVRPTGSTKCLRTANGPYRSEDKMYYVYAFPTNGYASCVDALKPLFPRNLSDGDTGYDVELMQRAIGLSETYQSGYFGAKTIKALVEFQRANDLEPLGICGPKTRALLNARYGQFVDTTPEASPALVDTVKKATEATVIIAKMPQGPAREGALQKLWDFLKNLLTIT